MRTVILNTLGSELRQTQLFYLPFREEQFLWVEHDMADIGSAAESICTHSHKQSKIQDYHLVVLASLAHYPYAKYQWLRKTCEELLFAHIRNHLLLPLAQTYKLPPKAASVVFVVPKRVDGTGDVSPEEQFDALLSFRDQTGPVERLVLTGDDSSELDLSDLFAENLSDYAVSRANELDYKGNEAKQYALQALRRSLGERLVALQSCRYVPVGEETPRSIPVEKLEMFPKATSWELFCIDLQMNLCDHLVSNTVGNNWQLRLQSRGDEAIQQAITLALKRVRYLRNVAPSESYFPLTTPEDGIDAEALPSTIWAALGENTELPGVAELKALLGDELDLDKDVSSEDIPIPNVKLRRNWIQIGQEKKCFDQLCQILDSQFAPDAAKTQQEAVLNTCSGVFAKWRMQRITRVNKPRMEASLEEMPECDMQSAQEQLHAAQQAYSKVKLDALEDYEDVRQEAEYIKSDFRKTWRLWPDDPVFASRLFWRYSLIMGVCFLVMVLLPYMVLATNHVLLDVAPGVYFAISAFVFAVLYLVGLLIWMRRQCAKLAELNGRLYRLLQKSHARRRASISATIRAYGKELPRCTIQYANNQQMCAIHGENMRRKRNYHAHMRILDKAEELLVEMHTLLRLPQEYTDAQIKTNRQVDYQREPNDPQNVPCYIFLSEKWGC